MDFHSQGKSEPGETPRNHENDAVVTRNTGKRKSEENITSKLKAKSTNLSKLLKKDESKPILKWLIIHGEV